MSTLNRNITYEDYYYMIADEGDTFDLLAFREYGDETLGSLLAEENPDFSDVLVFEGGEELRFPELEIQEIEVSLPPWRQGESEE